MIYIFGIVVAVGALIASIVHLGVPADSYFDFVAFVMVLGGTIATAAFTLPWELTREIVFRSKELFTRKMPDNKQLLLDCMHVNQNAQKGVYIYEPSDRSLAQRILRDGVELMQLGLKPEVIHAMLKERVYQAVERTRFVGSSVRSLSKYPPAFGLAGTVLGLVHLMRGISDGMSPQETGVRMAIALVATFYGLMVANFIVNPAGEAIVKNATIDEKNAEIAMQAVLLAAERANLLETQEMLNSYVEPQHRVDVLGLDRGGADLFEDQPQAQAV